MAPPARLLPALLAIERNRGGMGFLSAHVDARDVADIAAWLGAVVNGTVAVGLSMSLASVQAQGAMPGAIAPRFELPTRDGGRVDLDALRGRVVYLDVWASWCAPCRRSLPWMDAMHRRHASTGLEVVGVNVDPREAERVRFLASTPVGFTIALDPEARVAKLYGTKAMPTSVLIGRDGRVLYAHEGFRDADRAVLEALIEAALAFPAADASGAAPPAGGGSPR
ncbi:MAG: TlpA disulfide reductase family protein [Burkholderiales bacterium]